MPAFLDHVTLRPDEGFAHALDARDPLAAFRAAFELPVEPRAADGGDAIYVCGNSLGPLPRRAREVVAGVMSDWATRGVEGHFDTARPWYGYEERLRAPAARLVGAEPDEVALMNTLTVNLHLLMVSFYRPRGERHRILVEDGAFPSDLYAVQSQLRWHGFDPAEALVVVRPRAGEDLLRTEDIVERIEREGPQLALVLLPGVHYVTGQRLEIGPITAAAHRAGAIAGWDLAHAAGNVPLALHDDDVDFAAWCTYKYLNAGPGAVGGAFVHARHGADPSLPRFAGWWGNDPATRFAMHTLRAFVPRPGAAGWQASNPPILALAPLAASLEIFDRAGIAALRDKSVALTGYLEYLLGRIESAPFRIITPKNPEARGCQLSLASPAGTGRAFFERLSAAGIVADYREPDVVRVAPAPLYTTFHDVWRLARLAEHAR